MIQRRLVFMSVWQNYYFFCQSAKHFTPFILSLEGIANSEVQGLVAAETIDVVETTLRGLERNVQTHAPVEAQNEEIEVVAQANTRAHGHLLEEVAETELRVVEQVGDFLHAKVDVLA